MAASTPANKKSPEYESSWDSTWYTDDEKSLGHVTRWKPSSLGHNRLRNLLAILVEADTRRWRANLAILNVTHTHNTRMNGTRDAVLQLDVQLRQCILLIN